MVAPTFAQLQRMKRPELQRLCKELGYKANGKTSELLQGLSIHFNVHKPSTSSKSVSQTISTPKSKPSARKPAAVNRSATPTVTADEDEDEEDEMRLGTPRSVRKPGGITILRTIPISTAANKPKSVSAKTGLRLQAVTNHWNQTPKAISSKTVPRPVTVKKPAAITPISSEIDQTIISLKSTVVGLQTELAATRTQLAALTANFDKIDSSQKSQSIPVPDFDQNKVNALIDARLTAFQVELEATFEARLDRLRAEIVLEFANQPLNFSQAVEQDSHHENELLPELSECEDEQELNNSVHAEELVANISAQGCPESFEFDSPEKLSLVPVEPETNNNFDQLPQTETPQPNLHDSAEIEANDEISESHSPNSIETCDEQPTEVLAAEEISVSPICATSPVVTERPNLPSPSHSDAPPTQSLVFFSSPVSPQTRSNRPSLVVAESPSAVRRSPRKIVPETSAATPISALPIHMLPRDSPRRSSPRRQSAVPLPSSAPATPANATPARANLASLGKHARASDASDMSLAMPESSSATRMAPAAGTAPRSDGRARKRIRLSESPSKMNENSFGSSLGPENSPSTEKLFETQTSAISAVVCSPIRPNLADPSFFSAPASARKSLATTNLPFPLISPFKAQTPTRISPSKSVPASLARPSFSFGTDRSNFNFNFTDPASARKSILPSFSTAVTPQASKTLYGTERNFGDDCDNENDEEAEEEQVELLVGVSSRFGDFGETNTPARIF